MIESRHKKGEGNPINEKDTAHPSDVVSIVSIYIILRRQKVNDQEATKALLLYWLPVH